MTRKLFIAVFTTTAIVVGLSSCKIAYGQEVLNIELLCEGYAKDSESLLPRPFKERISIENNQIQDWNSYTIPISVSDTTIGVSSELKEILAADGIEVYATLDRLTGLLEIQVDAPKEIVEQNGGGATSISIEGTCQKLDPKKKLF